ncbi:TolB family protein [Arthrobacter nitrophenolicus]|uniref:Biopolymer transporter Tol n=1 Tax=Arthrobacter nitrophenolicus TaxID=683150 RepID=A0A4R5XQS8_9MICC|nr:PD40 domain-containing protein [Arthrobacter nitrophenolicus]TDL33950.1 biopolymer transporter Tol [Arthrobacter nitrophenolicus]
MISSTNSRGLQTSRYPGRNDIQPNQVSQLIIADVEEGTETLVYQSERLVESPNWTPDGQWLVVNSQGKLYRILSDGTGELEPIDIGNVEGVNNDHVLSPTGERVYFSALGHLYCVSLTGGDVRRVSNTHPADQQYSYWLHGISPDERTLAYVSVEPEGDEPRARRNLATIPAAGGAESQVTEGVNDYDGPEYSPDGKWIYYNSEEAATVKGHAQIFRMRPDGTERQQLTFDARVNWFPHLAPDGREFVYISYPPGTISHPSDMDVELRMMAADGGEPRTVATLFGGQGTMNCNSWAPDSKRFAFFAYPSSL